MASNVKYVNLSNELSLLKQEEPSGSEIALLNDCFAELDKLTKSHDDFLSPYLNSTLNDDYEKINEEYSSFVDKVVEFQQKWEGVDSDGSPSGNGGGSSAIGSGIATISAINDDESDDGASKKGKKKKKQKNEDPEEKNSSKININGDDSDDLSNKDNNDDSLEDSEGSSQDGDGLSSDNLINSDNTNNSSDIGNSSNNDASKDESGGSGDNSQSNSVSTSGNANNTNNTSGSKDNDVNNSYVNGNSSNMGGFTSNSSSNGNNNIGKNGNSSWKNTSSVIERLGTSSKSSSSFGNYGNLDRLDTGSEGTSTGTNLLSGVDDSIKDLGTSIIENGKASLLDSNLLNFGKIQAAIDKNKNDSKVNWLLLALLASGTATGGYIVSKKIKDKQVNNDDKDNGGVESWT